MRRFGRSCAALLVPVILGSGLLVACSDRTPPVEEEQPRERRVMRAEDQDPCVITEPCPEAAAAVESIALDDPRIVEGALFVDAREPSDFDAWHKQGARNVVYDILDITPRETVLEIAGLGAPIVVVYGDGDDPDSGEELARDLAGQGVTNVYFIEGGVSVLRQEASDEICAPGSDQPGCPETGEAG